MALKLRLPAGGPPTAKRYSQAGLPWFDYCDDNFEALDAQEELERLQSVNTLKKAWHDSKLPGNESCDPKIIVSIRKKRKGDEVREGSF